MIAKELDDISMENKLEYYTDKFSHLHTDVNRTRWPDSTSYRAPHKMLLLLSVIELIDLGLVESRFIEVTPELLDTFDRYWSSIMSIGTRGNIFLPFFYLKSEGFWTLVPKQGKKEIADVLRKCDSFRQLNDVFLGANLDEELFLLLQNIKYREKLRIAIIHSYFSVELQEKLFLTVKTNKKAFEYTLEIRNFAKEKSVIESLEEFSVKSSNDKIRDQGFRKAIVTAYEHRCATCGIRMLTPQGHTAVDAAHIIPWAESQNDDIRNGLCLCKLCHWAFDELLIMVTEKYKIKTSQDIKLNHNIPGHILQMEGRDIINPDEENFYPGNEFLKHHRARFLTAK